MNDWYGNFGMSSGSWVTMMIMMVLVWALVIWVVVMLVRATQSGTRSESPSAGRDPLAILDERFARGELDQEEYFARRTALGTKS